MTRFYVYEHLRPDTGAVFYVGKGTGKRAFKMDGRNSNHRAMRRLLASMGLRVQVRIHRDGLSEDAAYALEVEHIAALRAAGVSLLNVLEGGRGGVVVSPEIVAIWRERRMLRLAARNTTASEPALLSADAWLKKQRKLIRQRKAV